MTYIIVQKRLEIKREVPKKGTWLNKSRENVNEKKFDIYMKKTNFALSIKSIGPRTAALDPWQLKVEVAD